MAQDRLLLVEDDFDVAEMLLMYFQSIGYEVLHADHGALGVELARTRFPSLILLDIMLPDMDGYDVCVQLRKMSLTKYIPTIFLTQKDERSSKVIALQLGADDYITKPFDIDELRLRVEGSIGRAKRNSLYEPRTGLPTGRFVQEELDNRRGTGAKELYFVLKGFTAYTDVYSFIAANDVMFHAGKTIREVISEMGTERDFVGFINEEMNESFVVATYISDVARLEATITERFNQQVRTFYTFTDAERGGITLNPGTETERFVPLMSLISVAQEPQKD